MSASFLGDFQDDFCGVERAGLDGMAPSGNYFDRLSMDVDLQAEAIRGGRIDEPGLVFAGEDDLPTVGTHSLHSAGEIDELHSPNFGERSLDMRTHVGMIGDEMHSHALLAHDIGEDMVGRTPQMSATTHVNDHLPVPPVDYASSGEMSDVHLQPVHLLDAPLFTVPSEMLAEHDTCSDDLPLAQDIATSGGLMPTTRSLLGVSVTRAPADRTLHPPDRNTRLGELGQSFSNSRTVDGVRTVPLRDSLYPLPVVTASDQTQQPLACPPSRRSQQPSAISQSPPAVSGQRSPLLSQTRRLPANELTSRYVPKGHSSKQQNSLFVATSKQSLGGEELPVLSDSTTSGPPWLSSVASSSSMLTSSSLANSISLGVVQTCSGSLTEPSLQASLSKPTPHASNTENTAEAGVNLTVQHLHTVSLAHHSQPASKPTEPLFSSVQPLAGSRTPGIVSFSQSLEAVECQRQSTQHRPNQPLPLQPDHQTLQGCVVSGQNTHSQQPSQEVRKPRQLRKQQQQPRKQRSQLQQQVQGQQQQLLQQEAESTNQLQSRVLRNEAREQTSSTAVVCLRDQQDADGSEVGQTQGSPSESKTGGDGKQQSGKTAAAEPCTQKRRRSSSSEGGQEVKKHKGGWPKGRPRKLHTGAPRPPCTGWQFFVSSTLRLARDQAERSRPLPEISKSLGEKWATLSAEEKKVYTDMATQDRERYLKELQKFQSSESYLQLRKQVESKLGLDLPPDQQFDTLLPSSSTSGALLYCQVCQQQFTTHHNRREHMLGRQHQQNVLALVEPNQKCGAAKTGGGGVISPDQTKSTAGVSKKSKRGKQLPMFDPVCIQSKIGQFTEEFYDHHRVRELELQELRLSCAVAEQRHKGLLEEANLLRDQKLSLDRKVVALQEYGIGIQQIITRLKIAAAAFASEPSLAARDNKTEADISNQVLVLAESCSPVNTLGQSDSSKDNDSPGQASKQCSPTRACSGPLTSDVSKPSKSSHLEPYSSVVWSGVESTSLTATADMTENEAATSPTAMAHEPSHPIALSLLSCSQDKRAATENCPVPLELSKDGQLDWWNRALLKDQCANAAKGQIGEMWVSSEAAVESKSSLEKEGASSEQHLCIASQQLVSVWFEPAV